MSRDTSGGTRKVRRWSSSSSSRPILLLLVFGIVQFGILFNNYVALTDAVRAGARQAAVSRDAARSGGRGDEIGSSGAGHSKTDTTTSRSLSIPTTRGTALDAWAQGGDVTVTATYPYSINLLGFVVKSGTPDERDDGACGMTIDYRFRNIVIAAVLAAAAVLLTVVYVSTARDENAAAKGEREGVRPDTHLLDRHRRREDRRQPREATTVTRAAMAPKAVTSPTQIKSLYTTESVYAGEQLSLNRFVPPKEQGVLSKLAGKQRAVQVSGDANQMLAGTLQPGDRVDVVANVKNPNNQNDIRSLVVLRNIRVLQTQDGEGANDQRPGEQLRLPRFSR